VEGDKCGSVMNGISHKKGVNGILRTRGVVYDGG